VTSLQHVTLTTGHVRDSAPEEVSEEALAATAALLAEALEGYEPVIPHVAPRGVTLQVTDCAPCLVATVLGPYDPERGPGRPLVTFAVAAAAGATASALWLHLHVEQEAAGAPLATDAEDPPPAPWCAVRVEPGLLEHPAAAEWLGDFERCLAWAWVVRSGRS
jgi:hypothetical protein